MIKDLIFTLWFSDSLLVSIKNTTFVEIIEGMPDPTREDFDEFEEVKNFLYKTYKNS